MIECRKASPADAILVTKTRQTVWAQTYRGIYPDEMIDSYDWDHHLQRDTQLMSSSEHQYYLFMDGSECIGYFSFGPYNYGHYLDFDLCLNSLYICQPYQRQGLGRLAFDILSDYCRSNHIPKFFCGCNIHNLPAQGFYRHMGGKVGSVCGGHENRSDDIMHFEFYLGE